MELELCAARIKYVKIVHGYGSSGVGGTIRQMCRKRLQVLQSRRRIRAFCTGEDFGSHTVAGQELVQSAPLLRQDSDWSRGNPGVTIVLLK